MAEASQLADEYGTVGVIVPGSLLDEVLAPVMAALPSAGEATRDGLGRRVTVLAAENAQLNTWPSCTRRPCRPRWA